MPLPKLETPSFKTTLPTGEELKFRPFSVKEQKNLLIVAEGGTEKEILEGIVTLVDVCTFGKFDWLKQPTVNLEKAFLMIRAKSMGEVVELSWKCLQKTDGKECGATNTISVDVREAEAEPFPEKTIQITDDIHIVLSEVTVGDLLALLDGGTNEDLWFKKLVMAVEGEEVYTEFTKEEFVEFAENFPPLAKQAVSDYFENQPSLVLKPQCVCSKCGKTATLELKGVLNFFG